MEWYDEPFWWILIFYVLGIPSVKYESQTYTSIFSQISKLSSFLEKDKASFYHFWRWTGPWSRYFSGMISFNPCIYTYIVYTSIFRDRQIFLYLLMIPYATIIFPFFLLFAFYLMVDFAGLVILYTSRLPQSPWLSPWLLLGSVHGQGETIWSGDPGYREYWYSWWSHVGPSLASPLKSSTKDS